MIDLSTPSPHLTPTDAALLQHQHPTATWFAVPSPHGPGVIARAHTEAHDGGHLLPGHLAAADLDGLRAVMPAGLTFDPVLVAGSPPGCLGWWWP